MAKFKVRYYECYEKFYEVEADNKEDACKILTNDIYEGRENAPDQCYDSGVEATEMEG